MLPLLARRRATAALALITLLGACGDNTDSLITPGDTTPAVLSVASGNDQSGITGVALSSALTVKALTAAGTPAVGAAVQFAVTSGVATLSPETASTDANGEASTTVTLGAVAGAVQISATVSSASLWATWRATSLAPEPDSTLASNVYNPDWTTTTHGQVDPNYAVVFPDDVVNTLEITLTAAQWASIRSNMTSLFGYDFGASRNAGANFADDDPDYVAVPVKFNGKTWKKVGFRLKGNSSLSSIWGSGIYKLPFRLNMDKLEDDDPAIKNQRFYGFDEMSFSPGWSGASLIREKATSDIFRLAGIPAARTAFYRVYIDYGAGLKYSGVYTLVEVIDDTMVEAQFGEDKGNIYKPESTFQTFVESEFEKKNNSSSTFTDVQTFITTLNSSLRTSDAAQWRTDLETVFNVDHFLKWLAVNNTIVNWDSYGVMAHNYYLYNSPTNKLTWIPWDHNESMNGSPGIAGTTGAGGGRERALSLSMNEVSSGWPLIRNLLNDPIYAAMYKAHLQTFNTGAFNTTTLGAMFDRYTALISPYVIGVDGEQVGNTHTSSAQFTAALPTLKTHLANRKSLVTTYAP